MGSAYRYDSCGHSRLIVPGSRFGDPACGAFFAGGDKDGRLTKIAYAVGLVGFLLLTAFEWLFNIAMLGLLLFMLAYWIAPQRVSNMLNDTFGRPAQTKRLPASHHP
jgi:hypothetical protein